MSKGIVVDHKESGVRYAISEHNFKADVHEKVRELKPGETVLGYLPRRKESLADLADPTPTSDAAGELSGLRELESETPVSDTATKTTPRTVQHGNK